MKKQRNGFSRIAVGGMLAITLLSGAALTGCSTQSKMSDKEKADFRGGPMPAGFKDRFAPSNKAPGQTDAQPAGKK